MINIDDDALLRQIIVKHFTKPLYKPLKNNPNSIIMEAKSNTCADELVVEILLKNQSIKQVSFDGTACAVATASADIFLNLILNKTLKEVNAIIEEYQLFLNTGDCNSIDLIGDLIVFKNIHNQKNRIICAELAIKVIKNLQ
ncbi:FeS assembly protein [Entomoplasma ellychniae]|uniref:FeS assembly protein n=1 Tax=Entomoplasma ellychniae TaxID=2114 RepID=A0A8E2QWM6_9MOLU|nr:iron-sulfur cluster assembly scaffold protein [Entomoplasma ellychniae]PPE05046.1 FeS assembly protein [Entomoplasma ellychniae]